jgi:hypothetical protein
MALSRTVLSLPFYAIGHAVWTVSYRRRRSRTPCAAITALRGVLLLQVGTRGGVSEGSGCLAVRRYPENRQGSGRLEPLSAEGLAVNAPESVAGMTAVWTCRPRRGWRTFPTLRSLSIIRSPGSGAAFRATRAACNSLLSVTVRPALRALAAPFERCGASTTSRSASVTKQSATVPGVAWAGCAG